MYNHELLPCPICGGRAEYYEERILYVPFRNIPWKGVRCTNCGCVYIDTDKTKCPNDVMEIWNIRASLDKQPTVDAEPKWIPCSERLPEVKGDYLVTYHPCYWDNVESEIKVGIDSFRGKTAWAKRKYQRVIAWMKLPEPYKMDGEEKEDG